VPAVYIETYGCQMNVADTELILGTLGAHGYRRVDSPEVADVILLNPARSASTPSSACSAAWGRSRGTSSVRGSSSA
jgi:tRNA A37 methylthiotransferase MiaB